jgi:hypothetical protein
MKITQQNSATGTNCSSRTIKSSGKWPGKIGGQLRDHLGWALSLFLIGLSAKLWLMLHHGSSMLLDDQWQGEADNLYAPYFNGTLSLAGLFQAHNEHRIFFTRIYNLALLLLNRQWDNQLQGVGNAIIHSATLAGFGWLMAGLMGRRTWFFLWLPLAMIMVLPFAWENTLSGFQSQFYFLLITSLLTIWLLGQNKAWSARWWLGLLVASAGLFTNASGFLAVVPVAALVVCDIWKKRAAWMQGGPTLAVCGLVTVAGLMLKADVPADHVLQAHSVMEFLTAFGNNLGWPWVVLPPFALINLLPLGLLAWANFKTKNEPLPADRLILGLGLWVLLQGAAAAYARGAGGHPPFFRYMDTSSFILVVDCLCFVSLLTQHKEFLFAPRLFKVFSFIWVIAVVAGLGLLTDRVCRIDIPESSFLRTACVPTTREFMVTGSTNVFFNHPSWRNPLPYNVKLLANLLNNPQLRAVLPACIRDPLKVIPAKTGTETFIPDGFPAIKMRDPVDPCWGSYTVEGARARGKFESLPIHESSLPFLEIPVIGDLGKPGLSLEVIELSTGRIIEVRPQKTSRNQWQNIQVKAPNGEFKLAARDDSETAWFGFKEPRELGRLSYCAAKLLDAWKFVFLAGIGCLGLTLLCLFIPARPAFPRFPSASKR